MKALTVAMIAALAAAPVASSMAQQPYVYPAAGQTPERQGRDQGECHNWAVQQTGHNPYQGSAAGAPPSGGVIRGAAGGAALGAVGGAITGDAGKGAAIGAATGALFGGIKKHRQRNEQAYQSQQMNDAYLRAFAVCMEGRGYTVK